MAPVEILLDRGNQHAFAPGDRVSGTVTYLVKSVTEIRDVRIVFAGAIETRVTSSDIPRPLAIGDWQGVSEKQAIFRSEQRLVKEAVSAKPQKLSLKFEFEIPTKYSATKPDDLSTTLVSPYVQQSIPPSLSSGKSSRQSTAKIEYSLQASVVEEKKGRTERVQLPVIVSVPAQKPASKSQIYRFKFPLATWSSFRANTSRQGLRQRLSQLAHLNSPSIALDGGLHIPEVLSTTQAIDIRFSANQIRQKPSDPMYPHLRLKHVALTLYGFTEIACWYPDHPKGPQSIRHMHKDEIASSVLTDVGPHDGTIIKLDGSSMVIARNWSLAAFAATPDLVPDFTSALTLHRHSLMAHVELFHEESSHVMKLNVEVPIKILPPYIPDPVKTAPRRQQTSAKLPEQHTPRPVSAVPRHQTSQQLPVRLAVPQQVSRPASAMSQRSSYQQKPSKRGVSPRPIFVAAPQPQLQPQETYASPENRYSAEYRYSAELPAYSAGPDSGAYYTGRGKAGPPAYVELEARSIPPQSELPPLLRVVNAPRY